VCFEAASLLSRRLKHPLVNPFLIATLLLIGALRLLNFGYAEYNLSAQHLNVLMTPATVCLAVPLYRRLEAQKSSLAAVLAGVLAGVAANIAVIFLLCRAFGLGHTAYVSLLPKSITTPIALALCGEYGGVGAITILGVLFSGITGNVIAAGFLKLLGVRHAVARGLAIGTASHAIGTAKAMELGETEGAMSGLAIAVTGVLTVAVAPFFTGLI
jgi:putative effector of murein hydrolase